MILGFHIAMILLRELVRDMPPRFVRRPHLMRGLRTPFGGQDENKCFENIGALSTSFRLGSISVSLLLMIRYICGDHIGDDSFLDNGYVVQECFSNTDFYRIRCLASWLNPIHADRIN
jgi:hypothetical protein